MNQPPPGGMGAFLRMQLILLLLLIGLAGMTLGLAAGLRQSAGEVVWPLVLGMVGLLAAGLVWLHKGIVRPWERILERSQRELLTGGSEQPAPVEESALIDHERLRSTLISAGIGTWEEDLVTGRACWSEDVPGLLGITGPPVTPTRENFLARVAPEDRGMVGAVLQAVREAPAQHDGFQVEFRVGGGEGEVRWLEVKGRVFRDSQGNPSHLLAILVDCTQRCRADEALRAARADHEDVNSARSRFLANVSHELRTPLAGVIGLSELLQETPVNEEQRDYLQTLSRTAEGLLALLNDLLDLSKIEAGKLELSCNPFNLQEVAADAVGVFSLPAQAKGLRLSWTIEPGVPLRLLGDPHRLRQVLLNLIGNAIKFTPKGEVVLAVGKEAPPAKTQRRKEDKEEQERESSLSSLCVFASLREVLLHFSVRDTGIGIASDKLASIFQPFEQAEASTTRTYGGTGLGLTISARLVEMMGGNLSVQSEVGQGSTFTFTCPLQIDEAHPAGSSRKQEAPPKAARSLHILLVEDNPVNQQVLTLLLEKAGHRVRVAGNGKEALLVLEQEKFDLVLMDLQMPEMDGLRATRLLRAREKALANSDIAGFDQGMKHGARVPVVAVTANALQGERQRCLAAGMDDYLSKPIRGSELFAAIARLVGSDAVPPGTITEELAAHTPLWLQSLEAMNLARQDINRLVRTFIDTVPARLAMLQQAATEGNAALLQSAAHTLKGSLSVFSPQAAGIARKVEELARERQVPQAAAPLRELEGEVGTLLTAMTGFLQSGP